MRYIKVIIKCLLASLIVIALYFGNAPVTAYLLSVPVSTSPVPTTTPTPTSSYPLTTVQIGLFFDFDNGTETNDVDKADIWWGQLPGGERYLVAKNNALFAITGNNFTGQEGGCPSDSANYSSAKINGSIDNNQLAGTVICVRTNRTYEKTHYTEFEINSYVTDLIIKYNVTKDGPPAEQPFTFIKINSSPAGAEIWIDGNDEGKLTPDRIYFRGDQLGIPHAYELFLSGYQPHNETFDISKGSINKEVILTPIQATYTPVTSISATPIPATPIPATPIPTASVSATSIQATSVPVTYTPVTPISATYIPATSITTASIPATPAPVSSNAATSTSKSPTVPGFLALPLLIAIFFIYFLSFKNRR